MSRTGNGWQRAAPAVLAAGVLAGCGASSGGHPSPAAPTSRPAASSSAPTAPTTVVPVPVGWQVIGTSVRGRPIRMLRLGSGPRKVVWIGGIHGDEPEGSVATARLPQAFTAAGLGSKVTLFVIEDLNPDGRAADTRGNANGVDLNRNFPSHTFDGAGAADGVEPLSQPEARALADLLHRERPDLVLVAHAWRGRTFVNFDGPAAHLARDFGRLGGMPVVASLALGSPTPGSLGSWVGDDLGRAILTVEYLRGSDPTADWDATRGAILHAVAG